MVGDVFIYFVGLVADGLEGSASCIDGFGRAEEVQVGLLTQAWVCDVIWCLSETLDDEVFNLCVVESFCCFPIDGFGLLEAKSIVGKIGFEPVDDPTGESICGKLRQRQDQLCRIAEVEKAPPLAIGERLQERGVWVAKAKCSEHRRYLRWDSRCDLSSGEGGQLHLKRSFLCEQEN